MSAKAIYETAPLGALIKFSDDTPRPPARFARKLAAWKRMNGAGRLIRKTPPSIRGAYARPATITLHEGDFTSGGVILVSVHRTHDVGSALRFDIVEVPRPGAWRIVRPYGETLELLHLVDDQAAAEAWLKNNRHADARVEPIGSVVAGARDPEVSDARPAGFVIARVINRHGEHDYLCGWDADWGTSSSLSLAGALRFPDRAEAEGACERARSLVPTFVDGRAIEYRVMPDPAS
ncbi:hypothetical protein SAMN05519104_7835 [Rhizobiales bacterium GAS188]|nr:hypothetical protein SAMN05519104_7835 [Rhizobiales bacterium GAS188]